MRNIFLVLILANAFLLAWHIWVDPDRLPPPTDSTTNRLALFAPEPDASHPPSAVSANSAAMAGSPITVTAGQCLQLGPLPGGVAAHQAAERLGALGFAVSTVARDSQQWLGHWVQIVGFGTVPAAEQARQRLVAAGIRDAYLMQEAQQPVISLGVFRDRARADRVASAARALGFNAVLRARYRPVVEQWLLLRATGEQALDPSAFNLGSDQIVRVEVTACEPESALE
ncbi:MAG: SPOR domain-containing protein [Gammaproteobacteria bacterium]